MTIAVLARTRSNWYPHPSKITKIGTKDSSKKTYKEKSLLAEKNLIDIQKRLTSINVKPLLLVVPLENAAAKQA